MSATCRVCGNDKSQFLFQNKTVCLKCDELLFDIEIEIDETDTIPREEGAKVLHLSSNKKLSSNEEK